MNTTHPTQEVTMNYLTSNAAEAILAEADAFTTMRQAWIAKGRPADPADPYWASVLADKARREAEQADPSLRRPVVPLVRLG